MPSSSLKFNKQATLLPIKQSLAAFSNISSKLFFLSTVSTKSFRIISAFFESSVASPTSPLGSTFMSGCSAKRNLASLFTRVADILYLNIAGV